MRKVFCFQNLLLLLIRVKVGTKAMDIFSDEGVNVRRAPKTKKDFEHFGNPTATALLV
jgi:hypothetical protein